jgi:hypothetical protein
LQTLSASHPLALRGRQSQTDDFLLEPSFLTRSRPCIEVIRLLQFPLSS